MKGKEMKVERVRGQGPVSFWVRVENMHSNLRINLAGLTLLLS
jgi:hypothetical protein